MRCLYTSSFLLVLAAACGGKSVAGLPTGDGGGGVEDCHNLLDDDDDGALDCADVDCRDDAGCAPEPEDCADGIDNDLDLTVDCADSDCAGFFRCSEDCGNGVDDNGDTAVDCADIACFATDPRCGEVCGDGLENDGDGAIDCADSDCAAIPLCTGGSADGTLCNYGGTVPHPCSCADGIDNDGDGTTDSDDLQCFGPFDDDEGSYATGIPGDNNGSKANTECPFDGNSGPGNDLVCCNPADPSQNVTPNGCDNVGCCEVDVNRNGTGEHVYVGGSCEFAPACADGSRAGCACTSAAECDAGQFCLLDDDTGAGLCSSCEPCTPSVECTNPCACGEVCFGGFVQPNSECGGIPDPPTDPTDPPIDPTDPPIDPPPDADPVCPTGITVCINGDADCNAGNNERCTNGCCYSTCPAGVTPCAVSADCPTDVFHYCITGCCIEAA